MRSIMMYDDGRLIHYRKGQKHHRGEDVHTHMYRSSKFRAKENPENAMVAEDSRCNCTKGDIVQARRRLAQRRSLGPR